MILVDSSVVIDYAKRRNKKLLARLRKWPVSICGITRAEVLHGSRDSAHRKNLLIALAAFAQVAIPDSLWDEVGDNLAALRAVGITVPFQDAVLATVAIANDMELWTRDAHFALVQQVLSQLKLFVEPP